MNSTALSLGDLFTEVYADIEAREAWIKDGFAVGDFEWRPTAPLGEIVIHVGGEYTIEWERISTPEVMLEWYERLREKNWFDTEARGAFLAVWAEVYRVRLISTEIDEADESPRVS